jgi:uncharacterized membrane protein
MQEYILLAFISTALLGVNAIVLKAAKGIDPVSLSLVSQATALLLVSGYWLLSGKKTLTLAGAGWGAASGAFFAGGLLLFVIALRQGKASVVAPINALSAAVSVILAVLILGEKLNAVKATGIALAIVAAVLLTL